MQKILYALIISALVVFGVLIAYFYNATNGFNESYSNIEVRVNGDLVKRNGDAHTIYVGNSYVYAMKDNFSSSIEYELDLVPINDFDYKIGEKTYSWLEILNNEDSLSDRNLNDYFSINMYNDYFILKPVMSINKIVATKMGVKEEEIEFFNYKLYVDYLALNLTINGQKCAYSFVLLTP